MISLPLLLFLFTSLIWKVCCSFDYGGRKLVETNALMLGPNLSKQSKEERNYLKMHKCSDAFEAYSASYLISREHLIHQFTGYNLTWVNCEMGSFIMMNKNANPHRNINGSITQSLDVLDFSVVHLSWYERLQRRHRVKTPKGKDPIQPIIYAATMLRERNKITASSREALTSVEGNRTVAIMPFLASENGAGHSKLGNRLQYLSSCFWSIYEHFPHVVVFVKNRKDYVFARNESGLPFFDVVEVPGLPKAASLPVATVQQTKQRLIDGRWDFDYVYFTESDQILLMRSHADIFAHLKAYPRRLVVPHRLAPFPEQALSGRHKRNTEALRNTAPVAWANMSCCLPRQNCQERQSWISVSNVSLPLVNVYGLYVALGNINFFEEKLRACVLNPHRIDRCP